MEYENFDRWIAEVFTRFWAKGLYFEIDIDTLQFLYEDDVTPEEAVEIYG